MPKVRSRSLSARRFAVEISRNGRNVGKMVPGSFGQEKWDVEPPPRPPPEAPERYVQHKGIMDVDGEDDEPLVSFSSLLNKQVISSTTGQRLGYIAEVCVDEQSKTIVCMDMRRRYWDILRAFEKVDTSIFPGSLEQVDDVILVNEKLMYRDFSMDDAMGYGGLIGNAVLSGAGEFEGRVRDFVFGLKTGKIKRIKFDYSGNPLLPEQFVTIKSVEMQDVVSLEHDRVYIKDSAYAVIERRGTLDAPIKFVLSTIDDPEAELDYETRYRLWEQQFGQQYREYYGRDPIRPFYAQSEESRGRATAGSPPPVVSRGPPAHPPPTNSQGSPVHPRSYDEREPTLYDPQQTNSAPLRSAEVLAEPVREKVLEGVEEKRKQSFIPSSDEEFPISPPVSEPLRMKPSTNSQTNLSPASNGTPPQPDYRSFRSTGTPRSTSFRSSFARTLRTPRVAEKDTTNYSSQYNNDGHSHRKNEDGTTQIQEDNLLEER
eukprot:CAMPEP_0167757830 /NCGR_PEP_ID=MMETSP0110_2-20121227/10139_1 /TAXON_ID=629695 /ORGANISM="Gymnochlora sp., Strain CCMP2014" /LENGTH=485 /DNA_ID=CAMNT_0007644055 /DNA_START=104 /DNA_END=1562 /DNA_ORIENTATION=+